MKKNQISNHLALSLACLASPMPAASSGEPGLGTVAYGLRHTVVSNAYMNFSPSGTLLVSQRLGAPSSSFSASGSTTPFAIDIDLGQAASGLFVYPNRTDPQNGQALEGWAFGRTTNGADAILSGVRACRSDWGHYEAEVDFSPLGASRYRFELYCDRHLVGQADHLPGRFLVSTYDIEAYDPRANPWHRLPDGRLAAVVEFPDPTLFVVTNGFRAGGNRLLVIPEDLTNEVDHVTHVRVIGSGGLQDFEIQDERPVFFGTPHRALGGAVFEFKEHGIGVGNFDDGDAGLLIEGESCSFMSAGLAGARLARPDQEFSLGSSGSSSIDSRGMFLGPVGFAHADGAWRLYFVNVLTAATFRVALEVSQAGAPAGREEVETDYWVGAFSADTLDITRVGGFGVTHTNRGGFFFTLVEPVTLTTVTSNQWTGDTFFVSLADPDEHLGALNGFSIMGADLEEFTVMNETRVELPPMPLSIAIAQTAPEQISVDWPHFPCNCFLLDSVTNLNANFGSPERRTDYVDFHRRTSVDTPVNPESYFWLRYRYDHFAW